MKTFQVAKIIVPEKFSCEKFSGTMEQVNSLTEMRDHLGLTQKQVADALGVDPRTILNWENGHHEPRLTVRQMKALCRLFGRPIEDIPDDFHSPKVESA